MFFTNPTDVEKAKAGDYWTLKDFQTSTTFAENSEIDILIGFSKKKVQLPLTNLKIDGV